MIYLDNAASTQTDPVVFEAMMPYHRIDYGNPGSIHSPGRKAREAVEKARKQTANFLGCEPEQIIFTSSGTEANQLAIYGIADYLKSIGKTHIVTTAIEHESVMRAMEYLKNRHNFEVTYVAPIRSGTVYASDISMEIRSDTGLVCVMAMNNETGAVLPVVEIGNVCRRKNVLFMTDCVQAAGMMPIMVNTEEFCCDFMSVSSHKIHGPKGVGALFVRDKSHHSAIIHGSQSQEFSLRGGTENVPAIVGFGKACELITSVRPNHTHLIVAFRAALRKFMKNYGIETIVHENGFSTSGIQNMRFDGVDGESLLLALDTAGVYVSAGAACNAIESKPSHVLTAMGIPSEDAGNSIRISFSRMNTEEEVRKAAEIIAETVYLLRGGEIA